MADAYRIYRVTDFKFGAREMYPHGGNVPYLHADSAINEAERLNDERCNPHQDFYVVFKNGEPHWSPEENVVMKLAKAG